MTTATELITKQDIKPAIKRLMEYHKGRTSAITRKDIRRILEMSFRQDRILRRSIGELRREGFPILFSTKKPVGYYLPQSLAELKEGINAMRSYVIDECLTIRSFKLKGSQYIASEKQGRLI